LAVNDTYDKGPKHGFSARGYSAAYDADRSRAETELDATLAGRRSNAAMDDPTLKNPDGELQAPASMPEGRLHQPMAGPGPNMIGNSKGDGTIDPQGQQGGTEGGQPGLPPLAVGDRAAGTPLMNNDNRH
jgi:hypothetical protein